MLPPPFEAMTLYVPASASVMFVKIKFAETRCSNRFVELSHW